MSPSKAKGTNLTNRREGTLGNGREERSEEGFLPQVVLCLKDTTAKRDDFGDFAARGGGGGRKVGVLRTVAIACEREQKREIRGQVANARRFKN